MTRTRCLWLQLSITVKFDGVDGGRDGSSPVAASLLFRLFVSEGLAFGVLQDVVGLLAPISTRSRLEERKRKEKKREIKTNSRSASVENSENSDRGLPWL